MGQPNLSADNTEEPFEDSEVITEESDDPDATYIVDKDKEGELQRMKSEDYPNWRKKEWGSDA